MNRITALALVVAIPLVGGGCGFAVRHPAKTAAIFGASVALSTCELSGTSEHGKCALAGAGAAALLGLTVVAALRFGTVEADPDEEDPARARTATPFTPRAELLPETQIRLAAVPEYLKTTPAEVQVRQNGTIVKAPAEDQAVAATFAASPVRGALVDGQRLTILTAKTVYQVGEEVRVVHVLDAPAAGQELHVMGPKEIYGEFVDGIERTPPNPGPGTYDGRVVPSPAVDYNYEVTTYRFDAPGIHLIQWKLGKLASNVIAVDVKPAAP
ncbi:MAG: hypothetical protein KF773_10030 [Deltaproteobacteria bacterium]|nr:hypothetical protein [Deltaproteobacteria bacterium]